MKLEFCQPIAKLESAITNLGSVVGGVAGGGTPSTANWRGGGGSIMGGLSGLTAASAGVNLVAQLFAGRSANSAANSEAELLEQQGALAQEEANVQAAQKAREGARFRSAQSRLYNSSGVLLEGSPLAMLEETRYLAQEEASALTARGQAMSDLYKKKAGQTRNQGRNALIGSTIGGALGTLNTLVAGKRLGLFGSKATTLFQSTGTP